jgi:hypothetical protein
MRDYGTETNGFDFNPLSICIFIHEIKNIKMARLSQCSIVSETL